MHRFSTNAHDVKMALERAIQVVSPGLSYQAIAIANIAEQVEALDHMVRREWVLLTDHPADVDLSVWLCNRRRLVTLRDKVNEAKYLIRREINKAVKHDGVVGDKMCEAARVYDAYEAEIGEYITYAIDLYDRSIVAMIAHSGAAMFKKEVPGEPSAAPIPQST